MLRPNIVLLLLSLCVLAAVAVVPALAEETTTFVLVRHAEKESGANPRLTQAGNERAQALRGVLADAGVVAIYATEWCRTALTAEPTAELLGLDIQIQDNGRPGDQLADCGLIGSANRLDTGIATVEDLADHLRATHASGVVLVVGHSNTVPQLVEALGAPSLCPSLFAEDDRGCHIPDDAPNSEYHHLFVVSVGASDGEARLLKAEYGQ